ncbi:hypothetical protein HPB51_008715 [Rhipicephalus microplus]|uniref:Uncharacterized protein n=1 Tax=Rhipicephalus microplus TaxID=6941 RepID=A0A9J6F001_RHIMP|nr:hypothetical protein HPB51_008715 [Rhipicephalus microplus]
MGSLFSNPSAQRGHMSTNGDRSSSSTPLVTVSTAVQVTRDAHGSWESLTVHVTEFRTSTSTSSVLKAVVSRPQARSRIPAAVTHIRGGKTLKVHVLNFWAYVDAAPSSDSSDGSETDLWDNISESSSSDASDTTSTTLSIASSHSNTSLSSASTSGITISSDLSSGSSSSQSSDEWSTRSPPRKVRYTHKHFSCIFATIIICNRAYTE